MRWNGSRERMRQQIVPEHYAPVAVGGVGGSGTRLVSRILRELGYFMGNDVNEAGDNLWYSLLFLRKDILNTPRDELETLVKLFINAMVEGQGISRAEHDLLRALANVPVPFGPMRKVSWLQRRAKLLIEATTQGPPIRRTQWGWKEPNTHIILEHLNELLPRMRYVHVARNGLDMAYSENQRQLQFWGPALLGLLHVPVDPYHALRYWRHVHQRVLAIGAQMGDCFLFLNYDELCADPVSSLGSLCQFLSLDVDRHVLDRLVHLVEPPSSIGRFRRHSLRAFDPDDVAYVASLGFDTR